jgi:hypothetical protein
VPEFDNPGNAPTLKVLDDLMDSEYSTKLVSCVLRDSIIIIWFGFNYIEPVLSRPFMM